MVRVVVFLVNDKGENLYAGAMNFFNMYFIDRKFTRMICKRKFERVGVWRIKNYKFSSDFGGLVEPQKNTDNE